MAGRTPSDSGNFGLSVTRFVQVENDECQNAAVITPTDDDTSVLLVASTAGAQPSVDRFNGSPIIYYQFSITGLPRRVRISTCGVETDFPTAIHLTDCGCDGQGARFIDITSEPDLDCDSGGGNGATISFVAAVGNTYHFGVSGRVPTDSGSFALALTRYISVENDECQNAAVITPTDDDTSVLLVASTAGAQPSVDRFNGSPIIYYQFSITGLPRRVRISTCGVETDFPTAIHLTDCGCDGQGARSIDITSEPDLDCDSGGGNGATISFVAAVGSTYHFGVSGRVPTDSGSFALALTRYISVENDECQNAAVITPTDDDTSVLLVASTAGAQPSVDRFNGSPIIYYQFTNEMGLDRTIRITTCAPDTDFPTVLHVTDSGCDEQGARFIDITSEPDFDCDAVGNATTVEFLAVAGSTYWIGVSGRLPNDTGTFGLSAFYLAQ